MYHEDGCNYWFFSTIHNSPSMNLKKQQITHRFQKLDMFLHQWLEDTQKVFIETVISNQYTYIKTHPQCF